MGVCIVGAGSVGLTLAAVLEASGCLEAVYSRRGGSRRVEGPWGLFEIVVDGPPWRPTLCEYILVTVKAYDTLAAVRMLASYRVRAPVIVIVQNGVGGLEEAERAVCHSTVAGGVTDLGSYRVGDRVEVRGLGGIALGCRGRDCREKLEGLARCLRGGGMPVMLCRDIEPRRWLKLAVNAAINTVTALLRVPNRVIVEDPNAREVAQMIARIVEEEARRRGITLPASAVEEVLRVARATGDNISSTLQDLREGRRTEVDYILGPIASSGEVPLILYRLLKAAESISLRDHDRAASPF